MNTWDPKDFFIVYDFKIKKIIKLLEEADDEISDIFRFKNQENKDVISSNVQLILVFTFIDILGNYYDAYVGNKESGATKKFKDFVRDFCLVDENIYFKNRKHMKGITVEALKNLRNGLVHFYGIGFQKNILIASNDLPDEFITEAISKHSIDKDPIVVIPSELQMIVQGAAELFIRNFNINEQDSGQEKMEKMNAVDRILNKIEGEAAVLVKPE